MYVDKSTSKQHGKIYTRYLLRESYREKGKVKHRTIANISSCSESEIKAIKLALKHKNNLSSVTSLKGKVSSKINKSIGGIYLLKCLADRLGVTQILGNSQQGKLALWQIMSRILNQGSRLSAVRLAEQHAACELLKIQQLNEDMLYHNLDWLSEHQEKIEKGLFDFRYQGKVPSLFLYDVTSSYLEGEKNELSNWGYNRDKKSGKLQIVIGLLTDEDGVPITVEVFEGNTNDTQTFFNQIKKLALRFGVKHATMVGDRGMIKTLQINDLKEAEFNYITAITKPQIQKMIDQNILQYELFSKELCEVRQDGIRYVLKRNPVRVEEIRQNRVSKIISIQKQIKKQNEYLNDHPKAKIETAVKKLNTLVVKLKCSSYILINNDNRSLFMTIDEKKKEKTSKLDGCYVIKTDLNENVAPTDTVHQRYKDLAHVELAFRNMKTDCLEVRPIFVRKEKRTRGHLVVVMLAYIIIQELQKLWDNLNVTVQEGLDELVRISLTDIEIEDFSCQQIPKPNGLGKHLLKLANVSLPKILPKINVNVTTNKKLQTERNRFKKRKLKREIKKA